MTRRLLLTLVAALVTATACGIPRDAKPQTIPDKGVRDLVSPSSTPTTSPPRGPGPIQSVYFLRDSRLVQVIIRVERPAAPAQALALLLSGPTDEQAAQGLTSSIPPGTELLSASIRDGELRVNLSNEMNAVTGRGAKSAYAQLVFTGLGLHGVRKVRFAIDGKTVDASTDVGAVTDVTEDDYEPPLNPR